jgi:amidohydrolase
VIRALLELVESELPDAVALRHRLHAAPRLSGDEEDTADQLCAAIGLPGPRGDGERVAGTGRLLRLGPVDGPSVALRAELDGLPLAEATGLPFAATNGAMHACGHDVHCAGLVALARALRVVEDRLPRGVLLVLQPREEAAPTGAGDVVGDPAFGRHDVRAIVGAHVQPALPRGLVSARPGAVNAACDELMITISGRGAHAAYPHRGDDPVLALAQTVVALHHLVARRVDPLAAVVLTVGRMDAGTAANVIPPVARAYGTLRALAEAEQSRLREHVRRVVEHTAAAYGCVGSLEIRPNEPVLHNDPRLAGPVAAALGEVGMEVDAQFRSCGSDDFAQYTRALPALMLFVGVGTGEPDAPGLHDARFAPPDELVGDLARAYLAGLTGALRADL